MERFTAHCNVMSKDFYVAADVAQEEKEEEESRSRKPVFFPLCATLATQYVCICMWRPFCSALADVAADICRYDMGCSMYFCSYPLCVEIVRRRRPAASHDFDRLQLASR